MCASKVQVNPPTPRPFKKAERNLPRASAQGNRTRSREVQTSVKVDEMKTRIWRFKASLAKQLRKYESRLVEQTANVS
jgi:hypothetical protein